MKKLTVALALGLASSSAFALGLGQIKVTSGLNEPLRAEIPVLSSSASELRGLKVELASADEFARIGLSLAQVGAPLKFTVVKKHGKTVIEVTTKKAVSDPALDFLVEVNWANGKLLREYTILLDPPNMAPLVATTPAAPATPATPAVTKAAQPEHHAAPTQAATPATQSSTTTASAAAAKPANVTQTPAAPPPAPAPAPASAPTMGGAITVSRGDTLWQIAQNTHADAGVDVNEMMLALQRTNPGAFYKKNINALKSGAVLRMPDRDELAKMSTGAARAAVRQQNQRWASIRPQKPVMVANAGGRGSASAGRGGRGSHTSRERLALVPPTDGGDDVASDPGVAGGKGNTRINHLKRQLANAKTALSSAQQQSNDLQGRVKDLEGINGKNSHLISLKDAEIAELQRKLAAAQSAASAATAAPPKATAPAAAASVQADIFNANAPAKAGSAMAAATPAGTATVAMAPTPAASVSANASTPAAASTAKSLATTTPAKTNKTAPVAKLPATNSQVPPAASATPWYMQRWLQYLIGLVVLLLIVFGFMKSRRKKAAAPELVAADSGASPMGDEDEENALLDEIHHRPDDLASHMELASLYYAQRDQDKFEAAAETMHAYVTDPQCEEWQQVRAMGEELCPDSPLFTSLHSDGDHLAEHVADTAHDDEPASSGDHAAAADGGYSFDFDLTPAGPAASEPGATDAHDADQGTHDADADLHAPAHEADSDDDDLGFGISSEAPDDSADVAPPSPDNDIDEETAHGSFSSDPVDTKLDLARAYQDMGDAEGARAMLDEVLAEGTDAQKEIARKLIDELS